MGEAISRDWFGVSSPASTNLSDNQASKEDGNITDSSDGSYEMHLDDFTKYPQASDPHLLHDDASLALVMTMLRVVHRQRDRVHAPPHLLVAKDASSRICDT